MPSGEIPLLEDDATDLGNGLMGVEAAGDKVGVAGGDSSASLDDTEESDDERVRPQRAGEEAFGLSGDIEVTPSNAVV